MQSPADFQRENAVVKVRELYFFPCSTVTYPAGRQAFCIPALLVTVYPLPYCQAEVAFGSFGSRVIHP